MSPSTGTKPALSTTSLPASNPVVSKSIANSRKPDDGVWSAGIGEAA